MKILKCIFIMAIIGCLSSFGLAEEIERTVTITDFMGKVDIQTANSKYWTPAEKGMILHEGDVIRTKEGSRAILDLTAIAGEEATVELQENSLLMLAEIIKDEEKKTHKTMLDLAVGKVLVKANKLQNKESDFEVKTPTSIVGIRGTTFGVEVEALE